MMNALDERLFVTDSACTPLNRENPKKRATGFTLIEVLIALLVLSVGLVGVAALTILSLQNVHSGLYTSLASAAGLDYEERLWLQAAGIPEGTCPDRSGGAFVTGFTGQWTTGGTRLGLPGLDLRNGTPATIGTSPPLRVRIDLSWSEGRFDGVRTDPTQDIAGREVFRFVATAPCRRPL